MAAEKVDLEALIRGGSSRRPWLIAGGALALVLVAATAILSLQSGDSDVVVEPRPADAELGRLTSTVELFGSAAAALTDELSFGVAGRVASVDVEVGARVSAGQILARLNDADAQRRLESAGIALLQAELRLAALTADAAIADIAAAQQSTASSRAQLAGAEQSLAELTGAPATGDVDQARQAVTAAEAQLASARIARDSLLGGPTDADVAAASASVAQSESQVASAENQVQTSWTSLLNAQNSYCGRPDITIFACATTSLPLSDALEASLGSAASTSSSALSASINALLVADTGYKNALGSLTSAEASLASGLARRADLDEPVTQDQIAQVQASVASAQSGLDAARARERSLFGAPESTQLAQAQANVDSARAAVVAAQAREAELFAGADVTQVELEQLGVRLAALTVAEATEQLDELVLRAPFEGVVEAINVEVGDLVSAGAVAFVVTDLDRIVVELTVTEGDLFDLEPGQVGLATFDAIDGVEYPVRVTRVSSLPVVEQGVVTYAVEAEVLAVSELGGIAEELSALSGGATGGFAGFGGGAPAGVGSAGAAGGGGRAGGGGAGLLDQLLEGVELPEGVTAQDVLLAVASGEPLPDGVTLPEGFELPEQLRQRLISGRGVGGPRAAGAGAAAGAEARDRLLPAPGMTASVTLLAEVRPEAVLVPVAAVRQIGAAFIVTVPAADGTTERVSVTVGSSDGTSVEILEGVQAGDTVLIGAETEGVPFSATQQTQNAAPGGFGGGAGGFGGGGGGAGFGGGGGGR